MSESNRVEIKYVAESTYGTTPTNSTAWQALRFTSHSLSGSPSTVVSKEIRSDRQVSDLILVSQQVGGEIQGEFSCLTYDDLIQATHINLLASSEFTGSSREWFLDRLMYLLYSDEQINLTKDTKDISYHARWLAPFMGLPSY